MKRYVKNYDIEKGNEEVIGEIKAYFNLDAGYIHGSKDETIYKSIGQYTLKETCYRDGFDSGSFTILDSEGNSVEGGKVFWGRDRVIDFLKNHLGVDKSLIQFVPETVTENDTVTFTYICGQKKAEIHVVKKRIFADGREGVKTSVIVGTDDAALFNEIDQQLTKMLYQTKIKSFFVGNPVLFDRLKKLDVKKQELRRAVNASCGLDKPVVITVSGTPRAGKTTCVDNLYEFFKKADLRTVCLEEPAGLIYQTLRNKEEKKELLKDRVGFVDRQYEVGNAYLEKHLSDTDIVLCDRGILDTFVWYNMYYQDGMMSEERYQEFLKRLRVNPAYMNCFYALYTDPSISMERDFVNSLSIEPRTTMNLENVSKYNAALDRLQSDYKANVDVFRHIDTTRLERMDASIMVVDDAMDYVMQLCRRK